MIPAHPERQPGEAPAIGHGVAQAVGHGVGQALDLPLDAHLHTNLSPDSDVEIDVYCRQAVERRISEIAITDHLDFDPRAPAYAHTDYQRRVRTVREAAERWADQVDVRFGIEITYERRYEADVRDHLASHAYDFTIGSVHVGERCLPMYQEDRVAGFVAGKTLPEVVGPYFEEVEAAARSGLFETLGHLDFVKRYVHPHVMPADFAAAPELYEPLLRALIESGTGLEVNASGLRQSPGETYPAGPIVDLFHELGGRRVSAGSDAHRADSFAYGLEEAYELASSAGFGELAFRREGRRIAVPLPPRFAQQVGLKPGSAGGASQIAAPPSSVRGGDEHGSARTYRCVSERAQEPTKE